VLIANQVFGDDDLAGIQTEDFKLVQHPLNRFNNYLAVNKAPGA